MDTKFDISVVTPSLNQGRFIEQCIASVLAQEGVRCQHIVVDAESSDETRHVLARYRDRLDTVLVEPDDGQADALNKGFGHARAEFVCYLNSDDYLLPGALARAVSFLKTAGDVDAVYSHRTYVDGDDRFLRYWSLPRHSDYVNLRWDFIPQETCVWRRSAMDAVGGIDPTFQFAMDYDLFARMMRSGKRFVRLPEFLAVFREHGESKTTRLMNSLGATEVLRVQSEQGIRMHRWDRFVIAAFFSVLQARSRAARRRYPDGPPGFADRCKRSSDR